MSSQRTSPDLDPSIRGVAAPPNAGVSPVGGGAKAYPAPTAGGTVGGAPPPGSGYAVAGEKAPPTPTGTEAPEGSLANQAQGYLDLIKQRLARAQQLLMEMIEYGQHLLSVKKDRALLAVKSAIIWAGVGMMAAVAGVAALAYATVLLLGGIAGGLGQLFGRPWLGSLITGLAVLGIILVGGLIVAKGLVAKGEKALQGKYEALKAAQRQHFGRDVIIASKQNAAAGAEAK